MAQVAPYPQTTAIQPPKGGDGPPETEVPILQAILASLNGNGPGSGGGGGGGVVPGFAPVTNHIVVMGASTSGTIPAGAKGWSVSFLTGTGTLAGLGPVPAGYSLSDNNQLANNIAVTTDAASSAIFSWNT